MKRLACALGTALVLGAAAPAVAMDDGGPPPVSIQFAAYTPAQIQILAGDTAMWHNASSRTHTVTAADGSWSSPRVPIGTMFSHRFDTPGTYAYYCQIHPFMHGEVDVERLLLTAPREAAVPGRPFTLAGRAALPAGSTVTLQADTGAAPGPAATATVGDDGAFSATIVPRASATYRAVAGTDASPPVQVLVLNRTVTVNRARRGRRWVVGVRVAPASPGATVVLQLHLRERFGWWPQHRTRLGSGSTARFSMRLSRRVAARVVLTLRDGATLLATSRTVHIGARRRS
jgi:plastocyanin